MIMKRTMTACRRLTVIAVLALLGYVASFAIAAQEYIPEKVTHTCWFDIEIEASGGQVAMQDRMVFGLYGDVVPKTAANFFELCRGGFKKESGGEVLQFKNSVFHRVIPGFMAQGGDFTNHNGTGGKCIWGDAKADKFEDENFKEKHTAPGLLSMANSGPNTNGSQFFITFAKTPWLDGRHVVFGEVLGSLDFLKKMEAVGSESGKTSRKIRIMDTGVDVVPGVKGKADFRIVGQQAHSV